MNSINKDFGAHLRNLRIQKNLSQEKLAEAADISVSFLGGIERGQKSPTLETIQKLAAALQLSITELMTFSSPTANDNDAVLKDMINKFANDIKKLYE